MDQHGTYRCDKCDYTTSRKFNYIKHIKTDKHKSLLLGDVQQNVHFSTPDATPDKTTYRCLNCNRKYTAQRSLWRHSKTCQAQAVQSYSTTTDKTPVEIMTSAMLEMFKTNQEQMMQMIGAVLLAVKTNTAVDTVQEPSNHTTNNTSNNLTVNGNMSNMTNMTNMNNKTFNINMFLNEQCKDAMNMTEFVNTIELDTDDMKDVGKHGFVKGISKIFIENLEKTEVTKRPIHCSDIKREILYIKDDDKWERDNIKSQKIVNAVRVVEKKNVDLINKWAKEHPECENSDTRANSMYMTLSRHGFDGDDDNVTKVIKNIAHNVIIDKDEYAE
jgi:hypothetical protein